jgi:hypothetical protein
MKHIMRKMIERTTTTLSGDTLGSCKHAEIHCRNLRHGQCHALRLRIALEHLRTHACVVQLIMSEHVRAMDPNSDISIEQSTSLEVDASCMELGHLGLAPLGRLDHQKGSRGTQAGALVLASSNCIRY